MMQRLKSIFALLAVGSILIPGAAAVDYEKQIKPIFENACIDCHGPDKAKSELRVDQRAILIRGGDSGLPSVVPGNPAKSHLLDLIKGKDPDEIMPPKGDPLTKSEIALIEKWISEGAKWPGQMNEVAKLTTDHWSFQPVNRPEVPAISNQSSVNSDQTANTPRHAKLNTDHRSLITSTNPIDAFLAAKLKDAGIEPNSQADARSLIRRVSVILTGLPPKPAAVKKFTEAYAKNPEEAYAKLLDELLASPHFGERWAQHWLDVIRWAESNGSEANLYRKNAWVYRDYVVRAFNTDLPYDQFVREQIAGDSLGSGDATGFLVAGPHVPAATVGREPSAIRQARADRMDEIMQTVGASVMGVTIGCARCHNHKFDPFTITDYYAMTGVFQDIEFGGRHPEFKSDHPRRQRGEKIWKGIAKNRKKLKEFGAWEENWGAFREMHFQPIKTKAVRIQFKMNYVGLDELEVLGPEKYGENLAHRSNAKLTAFPSDGIDGRNPSGRLNDGEYGTMAWRARTAKGEKQPWVRFDFNEPVQVNRLRLSSNREYFYDTDYLTRKPSLPRYEFDLAILKSDGTWQPWVGTWWANKSLNEKHPGRKKIINEVQKHISTLAEEGPRPSFVGRLVRPAVTRVFHRGSPESPRDEVNPAAPAILEGDLKLTGKSGGAKRRLEFAKWISSENNPLTARVMVNRIWHHVFGSGIVPTTSDFGKAGAKPTHPELLEWLASEFVSPTQQEVAPWSMKGMIRLLVMSDAFRRSSLPSEDALDKDGSTSLLWRYPPQRVSAEVIRDGILQASGKLDTTLGGRSYRIHNEKKTYAQWQVVDNHGEHTWRRMLYQERMRRVDDQIFTAFDFPDCGQVRAKRPVSTTPLQALNLMNSDFVVEQAKFIAERAKKDSEDRGLKAAVRRSFALILTRQPDAGELNAAVEIAEKQGLHLVCRGLINANEFAFLP